MIRSDPGIAGTFLDLLSAHGVAFAVLSGEEQLASGSASGMDVDIVIDRPPRDVLHAVRHAARDVGLYPVMVVHNGRGSTTIVVLTQDGSSGAHMDLHYDPEGHSALGMRTDCILGGRDGGRKWPRAGARDRALYLLRKRVLQGDRSRARRLREGVLEDDPEDLALRIRQLFRSHAAEPLTTFLRSHRMIRSPLRARAEWLRARIAWVLRPPGFWVEFVPGGEDPSRQAGEIARRFDSKLLVFVAGASPQGPIRWVWWLREVLPRTWRPAIVVSWADRDQSRPNPDLRLAARSGDDAPRIVTGMAARH